MKMFGRDKKIEEIEKLKEEFIAVASHEMRTPLATVKNAITLISGEVPGPLNESQRKLVKIAERNVDKLALLINNFFLLAYLESEDIKLSKSDTDINEVIEAAIDAHSEPAKTGGITLEFHPDKSIGRIKTDRHKLIQAVNNIVSNAVKFSKAGGIVTITASWHDAGKNSVRVSVKDMGIGIDKKDFERIFNKFHQVDTSLTGKFPGSGMGLAICKRIIELHDGRVWVESEPGKGSTLHILLPAK